MADDPSKRDDKGRFAPGHCGGPGRKALDPETRAMLIAATPLAARKLIDALEATRTVTVGWGQNSETFKVPDFEMQLKAANSILDRIYGRPTQAITGEDGGPLVVDVGTDLVATLTRLAGAGESKPA